MANPRAVAVVLIVTFLIIGGLGVWVAYRSGELVLLRDRITDHEFPKALPQTNSNNLLPSTNDQSSSSTSMHRPSNAENPVVILKTSAGDVTLELYQDLMPVTAGNFLSLAEKNFYDGTKFHRVIDGFMIQGGDPNSKTDKTETYGTGGPGYAIKDEFVKNEKLSNVRGTIAMANSGPNSGGSQFFINLVDNTGLDFDKPPEASAHPVFGRVIAGMEVVEAIAKVPTNNRDLPLDPVVITDITVAGE